MQNIILNFFPEKNKIIHKILKTKMSKRFINSFVVMILSFIFKSLLYSLLSFIILFDNLYIDFFTQCAISILLCSYEDKIQNIINYFYDDLYKITRFIINGYSDENYKKWKNYIIGIILGLLYFYFYLFEINSFIIRIYIMQYAFCYIFMEIKENKNEIIMKLKREKCFILDKSIRGTDYILVEKKKLPPNISSEFDLITDVNIKKNKSFEVLDNTSKN